MFSVSNPWDGYGVMFLRSLIDSVTSTLEGEFVRPASAGGTLLTLSINAYCASPSYQGCFVDL